MREIVSQKRTLFAIAMKPILSFTSIPVVAISSLACTNGDSNPVFELTKEIWPVLRLLIRNCPSCCEYQIPTGTSPMELGSVNVPLKAKVPLIPPAETDLFQAQALFGHTG